MGIKSENISLLIKSLVKSVQTLTAMATRGVAKSNGSTQFTTASKPPATNGNVSKYCHYCGEAEGMIETCKHLKKDIKNGKCMRNVHSTEWNLHAL